MSTIFLTKAHESIDLSIKDSKERNYLKSWMDTIPARIYFLMDVITNIVSIPFATLKLIYSSMEALYIWDFESKNLKDDITNLYNLINDSISSTIGMILTSKAKEIHEKNNLMIALKIIGVVSGLFLGLFALCQIGGVELYYDPATKKWSPDIYLDFTKINFKTEKK